MQPIAYQSRIKLIKANPNSFMTYIHLEIKHMFQIYEHNFIYDYTCIAP